MRWSLALRSGSSLLPVLIALVAPAAAAAADPPAVSAVRLAPGAAPPVLDGQVIDEAWSSVEPYRTFTQQDPIEGAPASEQTEVRVLFDDRTVYLGVICFDQEPDKIIVSQARRDSQLTDVDSVIIVFDTFNDHQNAFVFGTNALGIEYDGQVAGEGQTASFGGGAPPPGATSQSAQQRGSIGAFNPNWDGDWQVAARTTDRGWEAEFAIPLKTLRYAPGTNRTWGFNVVRNIRHKNEQVYLSPIPRGYDIYRVSLAARLTGLDLQARRELKVLPFVLGSANKDYTAAGRPLDRTADAGIDVKWSVRPSVTADFTVNTDFAQVEADEEQVNLTRFDLFFPEKRPFFLENASTFQFGVPQQLDLFFSRRIGLAGAGASTTPIGIVGGARLSGKVGRYDLGLLDMQTEETRDAEGTLVAPANNFGVVRIQREVGRSTYGGIFVNREGTGSAAGGGNFNRAYGLDANIQVSPNAKLFSFVARTQSPGAVGADSAARIYYNFANDVWQIGGGYMEVGNRFNPEVGFVPRRGYRRPEFRIFYTPQPKRWPWIRRFSPHGSYNGYYGFDGALQTSNAHMHFFEIQPANGGRFGTYVDRQQDQPLRPFVVFDAGGNRVTIPPGRYTWHQFVADYISNPSAVVSGMVRYRTGGFYDGEYRAFELQQNVRVGSRFTASAGWVRQLVDLGYGKFTADLVPLKASYSFTTLASLQALVQYNNQTAQLSSNIRLALLNRSGTGLFVVFNDRRETTTYDPREMLGRSFIAKYTRLLDF
jgi:Domain of unknown function (DUF5916)/Carbohydrate family 9 binding domain-like